MCFCTRHQFRLSDGSTPYIHVFIGGCPIANGHGRAPRSPPTFPQRRTVQRAVSKAGHPTPARSSPLPVTAPFPWCRSSLTSVGLIVFPPYPTPTPPSPSSPRSSLRTPFLARTRPPPPAHPIANSGGCIVRRPCLHALLARPLSRGWRGRPALDRIGAPAPSRLKPQATATATALHRSIKPAWTAPCRACSLALPSDPITARAGGRCSHGGVRRCCCRP